MLSRHSLLALLIAPLVATALPALSSPRYTVTALPAGTNATGINNAGQLVGDMIQPGGLRGFVWSAGTLTEIGTLGGQESIGRAINNGGVATGYASRADGNYHAFIYGAGTLTPLAIASSEASFANAINDAGQVAGNYFSQAAGTRAFLYANGASQDLGSLGGNFVAANGINNAGHVVGFAALDDSSPWLAHAFLYADGVMTDLGTMAGASLSEATAINDRGQIAGHGWVQGSHHAFLYQNGVMQDLGTLGGRRSFAFDINNRGQVVGNANDPDDFDYLAYLYEDGVMTDLNTLIDPASGWVLRGANGINDSGQIAAWGCRDDDCRALLLDVAQVPAPGTLGLMLAGLALVGWRATRRAGACLRPRVSAAYRYA